MRRGILTVILLLAVSALCGGRVAPSARAAVPETNPSKRFMVVGKVTDERGGGIGGVEVRAYCGYGPQTGQGGRLTGSAFTAEDGSYRLRFGPGVFFQHTEHPIGFQAATISPQKDGLYEKDFAAQGNLAITDRAEDDPLAKAYAKILRSEDPFEVNFTMLPAARVHGQLLDAKGKPLPVRFLSISGDKLPPAQSVLGSAQTDADGKFRFESVPPGQPWIIYSDLGKIRREYKSSRLDLPRPGRYRFNVTVDESAPDATVRLRWKLIDAPKEDAQANAAPPALVTPAAK